MLIDSHAHYDDSRFESDREEAIDLAEKAGVDIIVNAASDLESSEKALELSRKYPFFYALAGVHPHEAQKTWETYGDGFIKELERLYLSSEKAVAIGEIGLDYHYDFSPRPMQKKIFEMQMELAAELSAPVVIHSREAMGDTLEVLRKYKTVKGVVHSFSGSEQTLSELVSMGYYISLGGTVTFKNARIPVEAAKACPIDRLLLETDAPYLTPVPHRGERNGSHFIIHTAEFIAELRGMDTSELCDICAQNTKKIFGIV